jgi:formylglycine-generating enzyme required for sulfatase activity
MKAINPTQIEKSIKYKYSYRMGRGGSKFNKAWYARASRRDNEEFPSDRSSYIGFRLVRNR